MDKKLKNKLKYREKKKKENWIKKKQEALSVIYSFFNEALSLKEDSE